MQFSASLQTRPSPSKGCNTIRSLARTSASAVAKIALGIAFCLYVVTRQDPVHICCLGEPKKILEVTIAILEGFLVTGPAAARPSPAAVFRGI